MYGYEDFDTISISSNETARSLPIDRSRLKCAVSVGFYANINEDGNEVHPWTECHVFEVMRDDLYKVRYTDKFGQTQVKIVANYDLAEARPLGRFEIITRGVRVIAQRDPKKLPYRFKSSLERDIFLFCNSDNGFYAGFTGKQHTIDDVLHSMVFFDDGHVQYVPMQNIRNLLYDNKCAQANENVKRFYEYYMNVTATGVATTKFQIQIPAPSDYLRIDSQCYWEEVQVQAVEGDLMKVFFMDTNRYEWLWIGSPRIKRVWKNIMKDKRLNKNTPMVADSHVIDLNDADDLQDRPLQLADLTDFDARTYIDALPVLKKIPHRCSKKCVPYEQYLDLSKQQAFARPMLTGWKRIAQKHNVAYRTPCGLTFDRYANIRKFLRETGSNLTFECFTFNVKVDCLKVFESNERVLIEDISNGKETIPVRLVGSDITLFPSDFEYITGYYIDSHAVPPYHWHPYRKICCDCKDTCSDRTKCACQQFTHNNYISENPTERSTDIQGFEYGHLYNGVSSGVFECHDGCACRKTCMNKVISRRQRFRLEVFQTKERGWGVRTRQDLPAGVYISNYVGDLLPDDHLNERAEVSGDSYFFILKTEGPIVTSKPPKKRARKSTPKKDNETNPLQPFLAYFPLTVQSANPKDKKPYSLDARYRSNLSRFMNHSCDPNLFIQIAYIDTHDTRFPWAGFFTNRFIKAGEEITFDYGYKYLGRGVSCKCGAKNCTRKLL